MFGGITLWKCHCLCLSPKTASKYLSFETNLGSVAQTVLEWDRFTERQSQQNSLFWQNLPFNSCALIRSKRKKSLGFSIKNLQTHIFQVFFFRILLALLLFVLCPHLMLQFREIILYLEFHDGIPGSPWWHTWKSMMVYLEVHDGVPWSSWWHTWKSMMEYHEIQQQKMMTTKFFKKKSSYVKAFIWYFVSVSVCVRGFYVCVCVCV